MTEKINKDPSGTKKDDQELVKKSDLDLDRLEDRIFRIELSIISLFVAVVVFVLLLSGNGSSVAGIAGLISGAVVYGGAFFNRKEIKNMNEDRREKVAEQDPLFISTVLTMGYFTLFFASSELGLIDYSFFNVITTTITVGVMWLIISYFRRSQARKFRS